MSTPAKRNNFSCTIIVPAMGAIRRGARHGGRVTSFFQTVGIYAMSSHIFSLGFVIYWFHTNLSPRQANELESYPNHPWIQQVLQLKSKKAFLVFGGGFLEVTSQRRHVLLILASFGRSWAPTH